VSKSTEHHQKAVDAGLLINRTDPLNGETPVPAFTGTTVVPTELFYLRNHFGFPRLDAEDFRLSVHGLVEQPLDLSLSELHNLPSHSAVVTLECAGNGRSMFEPAVPGEPWRLGAAGSAEWTGVPVTEVLDCAGVKAGATDVIFRGADSGLVPEGDSPVRFERSLTLDQIRDSGALLAFAMNSEPLTVPHGYPLRLVVPNWFAVASVKWLTEILVTDGPSDGFYQADRYWYEWVRDGRDEREPVTLLNVREGRGEPKRRPVASSADDRRASARCLARLGIAHIARQNRSAHCAGAGD
jgi:DMSO/TMAO reductase YedYZ molybdopterin-dependent catalytic subunit